MKNREIKYRQLITAGDGTRFWHYWGRINEGMFVSPRQYGEDSQQYTGLLDKNGKEIYEGDIVKDPKGQGVVGYASPMFVVQTGKEEYFMLGAGNCYPNNYQLKETEVIGNIYENPELLNL